MIAQFLHSNLPALWNGLAVLLVLWAGFPLNGPSISAPDPHPITAAICLPFDPSVSGSMIQSDCEALVQFYFDTGGSGWVNQSGWLTSAPPCTWYGVSCTQWYPVGYIWRLNLENNNLSGPISSFSRMSMLHYIDLRNNHLSGRIDVLCSLTLIRISLSSNDLDGPIPPCLGAQKQAYQLGLTNNHFSGPLPSELGQMSALELLWLGNNALEGPIPPQLGDLSNVRQIYLHLNQLSGTLPPSLGRLENLDYFYLDNNQLTGSIPREYGKMKSLQSMSFGHNQLDGMIPSELAQLTNLSSFSVDLNEKMHGPLPKGFLKFKFNYLNISGSKVCVPAGQGFQDWLATISIKNGTENICKLPVVLIHGLNDRAGSWFDYINTYLPSIGATGYPVGLDTGYGDAKAATIAQNALTLKNYIQWVKQESGQDQVNIVAHSMGGLVARKYIAAYMDPAQPDVYQLIMLGTPNGGSNTAALLNALRGLAYQDVTILNLFKIPYIQTAIAELTPSFMTWFNGQVQNTNGVSFYALAGNYRCVGGIPIYNPLEGPVNDVIVSESSVRTGVPLAAPLYLFPGGSPGCTGDHRHMRDGAEGQAIFNAFVKPLLENTPVSVPARPSEPSLSASGLEGPVQFSHLQAAVLPNGGHLEFPMNYTDPAGQVVFAVLGDPAQMQVSLVEPGGRLITPATVAPQIQFSQMNDFIYMTSYSVTNPAAGTWKINVDANSQTPSAGLGLAVVEAVPSNLTLVVPPGGESIVTHAAIPITARLASLNEPVPGADVKISISLPGGATIDLPLWDDGSHSDGAPGDGLYGNTFSPPAIGAYSGVVKASGSYNGLSFDRSEGWAIEVAGSAHIYLPFSRR